MHTIGVIPARMASSRLPGKPLAKIRGTPMIGHVYHRCRMSRSLNELYIATCDDEIRTYCATIGAPCVMTSDSHERATDRTAEAMHKIEAATGRKTDVVVMIQGDEPMVFPEMIDLAMAPILTDNSIQVVNLMANMDSVAEFEDPNEVKVVVDLAGNALYFSREPIPSRKKGSTIVPMHVIHAVHAKGVPLVQVYGSTETCPIAVYLKAGDAMRKPGSTGRVAAHCRLRLVDGDGNDVAQGVSGEIMVKGDNVMSGYWNAPQATAAVLNDGWFRTGDVGHFDEEGYLYVDGRSKDMIISGGENIYPAEIENLLIESPDIAEASVIGRPDERWGEIVVAVVVPRPDHTLSGEQVLKLLEGRIARFKHPKEVVVVKALPKTALGKIRKEDVRKMVAHEA